MTDVATLIEIMSAGIRWRARDDVRDLLFGPGGLRLAEWLESGAARIVKHGPHRTVYSVRLPGCSFFLKHYRLHDTRAWLRELVRPAKARMEFDRAVAIAAAGIPTAAPLAVGESLSRGPADSFLITQALDDTMPLSDFIEQALPTWDPKRQARMRIRLAKALADFVARMHDAGIRHNDFHPGNLLFRCARDDEAMLYLIDLHAVTLGRSLGWPARRANLVMLNRWFTMRVGRADRLRFWRAYAEACAASVQHQPQIIDQLGRDLERRTWLSNLAFWRSRDRRCLENNRYYRRLRAHGVVGHVVADLDVDALKPILADPDAPFQRGRSRLLKNSRGTTVSELTLTIHGEERPVIYKRFRITSWRDPWASLFRRSPALRSWVFGHGLRERCLPTARPLAVFHRCVNGLAREGYLLTEKIPHAVELRRYIDNLSALPANEHHLIFRVLIERVAILVRDLHARRLSHRDLKAANILVSSDGRRAWLIDLVGMRRCRRLPRRRRVQNLARLHASFCQDPRFTRTDKLRFLRTYLQWGLFGRHRWKRWWHEIAAATEAKVARNLKSSRPLA